MLLLFVVLTDGCVIYLFIFIMCMFKSRAELLKVKFSSQVHNHIKKIYWFWKQICQKQFLVR